MKEGMLITAILPALYFAGCVQPGQEAQMEVKEKTTMEISQEAVNKAGVYQQITPEEAKSMMGEQADVIPGKESAVLVYC